MLSMVCVLQPQVYSKQAGLAYVSVHYKRGQSGRVSSLGILSGTQSDVFGTTLQVLVVCSCCCTCIRYMVAHAVQHIAAAAVGLICLCVYLPVLYPGQLGMVQPTSSLLEISSALQTT
jgi:hypothetical protein